MAYNSDFEKLNKRGVVDNTTSASKNSSNVTKENNDVNNDLNANDPSYKAGKKLGTNIRKTGNFTKAVLSGATFVWATGRSLSGIVDIVGLVAHKSIYGLGEWISFGIPAVGAIALSVFSFKWFKNSTTVLCKEFGVGGKKGSSRVAKFVNGFNDGISPSDEVENKPKAK